MGIFKKLGDLAKSNLNAFLNQVEDKEKLFQQAILDMEDSKKKARLLLVSAMASVKLSEQQQTSLNAKISQLKAEAEEVLKEEDETKARALLSQKQALIDEMEALAEQIAKERHAISTINKGLNAIEEKISALKSESAIALGQEQIENDDAFSTFARMEEKIGRAENEVEALKELLAMSEKEPAQAIKIRAGFDKHSDPEALDAELAAIKKKLNDS